MLAVAGSAPAYTTRLRNRPSAGPIGAARAGATAAVGIIRGFVSFASAEPPDRGPVDRLCVRATQQPVVIIEHPVDRIQDAWTCVHVT